MATETAIDRYKAARAAVDEHDDTVRLGLLVDSDEVWHELSLRSKLRILLGDAARTIGFAVWEIRHAAGELRRGDR